MGPFTSNERIVKEMLAYAERFVKPKIILLDRGFYSVKVIKLLKSRKQDFIMPANRTSPIKELCREFESGNISSKMNYTVKGQDGTAEVNLVFTKRETKRGTMVHPFITSLDMGPEKISKLFGWRWRIETNNRELGKFKALTTSPCMKIRRIYFALSMILYNFWIVVRGGKELPRGYEFKEILEKTLTEILREIRMRSRPPPIQMCCC